MQKKQTSQLEFIAIMASLMAMVALSIDALLPALDQIGITVGFKKVTDGQLLVTMIFLGLGIGQLFFGPLSDTYGRKKMVYAGFILFVFASFICVFSESLTIMIAGRILQGIALSAPRTISISIIRDSYEGDYMAKIMSFVTVIFIIVPTLAPALGKFILDYYSWQAIFYVQLFFAVIIGFWFAIRQPETLPKANRIPFTLKVFITGTKEVFSFKQTVACTAISALITGSFMVYLSASQQVFQLQYGLVDEFPYIFASLALTVGAATFLNGKIVMKYGMEPILKWALIGFAVVSVLYVIIFYNTVNPSIEILLLFFGMQFFFIGFIFGNLRALMMQPIGHIAGIGAAITGFIATLFSVPLGTFIGSFVNTTALPMFIGFAFCGCLSVLIYYLLKRLT
ncbi:MAG: multidrug effflux MFS transporter [Flavobacteriaceae bacterium]|nr:multidrug effflux MFS transporter [Flavobacteriaceae bacterium]